jgi:hypothetical protein
VNGKLEVIKILENLPNEVDKRLEEKDAATYERIR